jgi:hypothetical protein
MPFFYRTRGRATAQEERPLKNGCGNSTLCLQKVKLFVVKKISSILDLELSQQNCTSEDEMITLHTVQPGVMLAVWKHSWKVLKKNNLLHQLGTSSANTTCRQLVNRFVTTCLQTGNNLCVFMCVIPHWLYFRMAGNWHGFPYVYIITNL